MPFASGNRWLFVWLSSLIVMVITMVMIGGITRVTGSGLSMVEWRPLMGWLPPLNEKEWLRVFDLYKKSPEFISLNSWMDLGAFKGIFWWEYIHRLWGRLIGLVFFIPLIFFLIFRQVPKQLTSNLILLTILGCAQGFIGWWMVKSGLSGEPAVSQYRLTVHLGMAFIILGLLVWTSMDVLIVSKTKRNNSVVLHAEIVCLMILFTILAGALVAGLDAGRIYNSFPFMGNNFVPEDYLTMKVTWRNFFENPATVQFNHRLLAITTSLAVAWLLFRCLRPNISSQTRLAIYSLAALVALQFSLGVSALINGVPDNLAVAHQLVGVCVFINSLIVTRFLGTAREVSNFVSVIGEGRKKRTKV